MQSVYRIRTLLWISSLVACIAPTVSFAGVASQRRMSQNSLRAAAESEEPDLFDYFDPLLSPHAYPDGIAPDHKPNKEKKITEQDREKPMFVQEPRALQVVQDPTQVFDPTLSPHAYPQGTPSTIVGDKVEAQKKVGILLIDHGSKKQASNERLQELARQYQQSVDGNVVVKASHMEIAEPTIPMGLEALLEEGVGEEYSSRCGMCACCVVDDLCVCSSLQSPSSLKS